MVLASIIIPAFNAAGSLPAALASALAQTEARIEVLVVDDCSTDDTAAVAARAAAADGRVRLLRMARNGGPAAARNRGIAAANGDWIALLDADDHYQSTRIARLLALAEAHHADMVADNLWLEPEGSVEPGRILLPDRDLPAPRLLDPAAFVAGNLGTPADPRQSYGFLKPMFRARFLSRHGIGYDERNRFGEDFLLYMRCLMAGAAWWITPEPLYRYTVRKGSLTEVQTSADLQRIRQAEQGWLDQAERAGDRALAAALRRHKRKIDRSYYYRAFTDAVKARQAGRAAGLLFESGDSLRHIAGASMAEAPVVLRKALRGGYGRAGA